MAGLQPRDRSARWRIAGDMPAESTAYGASNAAIQQFRIVEYPQPIVPSLDLWNEPNIRAERAQHRRLNAAIRQIRVSPRNVGVIDPQSARGVEEGVFARVATRAAAARAARQSNDGRADPRGIEPARDAAALTERNRSPYVSQGTGT